MANELTLVAMPKPFGGEFDIIQRNAIGSWLQIEPRPTIILIGDEHGTSDVAAEIGAIHIVDVRRSTHGTPLVGDIFRRAEEEGDTPLLAYVNADIVLLDDFAKSIARVRSRCDRFVVVGRRWDLRVTEPLVFDSRWRQVLRARALTDGQPHAVTGIDYFVYPRGLWGEIPDFAIGRFAWDNWLLWRACDLGVPLVDASAAVLAIHQEHAPARPDGSDIAEREDERIANVALAGSQAAYYTLDDASHMLTARGWLTPALTLRHVRRRLRRSRTELARRAPVLAKLVRRR